jgi:hypothetical protein
MAHTNGNGFTNGSVGKRVALRTTGFGVAEGVSILASLGAFAYVDKISPAGVDALSKTLSKIVVEPYLDNIEWGLSKVCKLEECQHDREKTREQRALDLSHNLVKFNASWAVGMIAKIMARKKMDTALKIPYDNGHSTPWWQFWKMSKPELRLFVADEGVHYGSLLMLNTGVANVTDEFIRTTTNVLEKCGMDHDRAHELATYSLVWELPNVLGFASGTTAIALNEASAAKGHGSWRQYVTKDLGKDLSHAFAGNGRHA